jgi:hypothetical protein
MMETPLVDVRAPVAVVIPTYARDLDVLETLRRIHACSPQ